MIQHIGEVLAVIAAAFIVGSIVGWIAYRWIDHTDYAFDQRDLADTIGRLFGIRTPPPAEEPATAVAVAAVPVPASRAPTEPVRIADPRPEPVRRPEPVARLEPVTVVKLEPVAPPPETVRPDPWIDPPVRSEAAEDLRKRVQSSTRALAWREARDERLRPGESAASVVAGTGSSRDEASPATPRPAAEEPKGSGKPADAVRPAASTAEPALSRKDDDGDHDEPWAAAPAVWPMDLHAPAESRPAPLALPAPVQSEIRLVLAPVATPTIVADDIWSDEGESGPEAAADPGVPLPSPEDRPPPLESPPAERDNLRRIKGIGQGFEKRLNQLGIYRYAQIAAWTERHQAWVSAELGFPGRVERDGWPAQAGRLARSSEARGSQAEVVRDP